MAFRSGHAGGAADLGREPSFEGASASFRADRPLAALAALEQLATNADHAACRAAAEQVREEVRRTTACPGVA